MVHPQVVLPEEVYLESQLIVNRLVDYLEHQNQLIVLQEVVVFLQELVRLLELQQAEVEAVFLPMAQSQLNQVVEVGYLEVLHQHLKIKDPQLLEDQLYLQDYFRNQINQENKNQLVAYLVSLPVKVIKNPLLLCLEPEVQLHQHQ